MLTKTEGVCVEERKSISNRLINEKSPYLLQHAHNPVDWYPWGDEAFEKAKTEDKPVFLSIGYSTCHWCHVMARESFRDEEVAAILNEHFIAIKVDKEERPDVDAVYMRVCQTLTGNGGWPLSIFLTPEQKPFLAGTYFPKNSNMNTIGFLDLLSYIADTWRNDRERLLKNADVITEYIGKNEETAPSQEGEDLIDQAVAALKESFDDRNGGFGMMPKFPTSQKILFLLERYETTNDGELLKIAEKTLMQMYRGGLFDHVGGGFCRYSTDPFFLVPHFEKMLYDNALLTFCYAKAYEITENKVYRRVAERTANYIFREMTSSTGGFYSAQDADSEGEEGKYYLFTPREVTDLLGEEKGKCFNTRYDITEKGNFEGKNIPNLLKSDPCPRAEEEVLPILNNYRKTRTHLFTDDKVLTSWNAMMIAALAVLYRVTGEETYLQKAQTALRSLKEYATSGTTLLVGQRDGQGYHSGFFDDYAYYIFALLQLYEATLEENYLIEAENFCDKAVSTYYDEEIGGFYLSGTDNEELIAPIKDVFDTAVPSNNAVMTDNLLLLSILTKTEHYEELAEKQIKFMRDNIGRSPVSSCYFLMTFNRMLYPAEEVVCVSKEGSPCKDLPLRAGLRTTLRQKSPDELHPLINNETTYYVCENRTCLPPTNHFPDIKLP